jgi:hypothetical protein
LQKNDYDSIYVKQIDSVDMAWIIKILN